MAVVARLALLMMLAGGATLADDERAEVNYMLHCQGCHLPQAEGFPGRVPAMKDFVGYFLHSQEGREFLIRVPGVAQSALGNGEVAELMNWLLRTYSAAQVPERFAPFTPEEVAALRTDPEQQPAARRESILAGLAARVPALADERAADN